MIFLLLCILSSTGIFLVFKFLDKFKLPSFPVIIINYLVASLSGLFFIEGTFDPLSVPAKPWFLLSILIGVLFILMFFLIAKSSSEAGISITTVASKMSVIFPITYSILIDSSDKLTILKSIAILLALSGVLLTVYQPGRLASQKSKVLIPLVLFVGMGLVDSMVKHAQHYHITESEKAVFTAVLFFIAFITGVLIMLGDVRQFRLFRSGKTWIAGVILGLVNFGSIYFMVSALNYRNEYGIGIDSSVVWASNNIGIVSLSVLAGWIIFAEKLRSVNYIGIGMSALAIILFSFS